MSWMDSWSRPGKSSATPPPLYATRGETTKYCHTCGRVMSATNRTAAPNIEERKYCSSRCRSHKPGSQDRKIESAFVALLMRESSFEGEEIPQSVRARVKEPGKGEPRIIVPCSAVEELIFGSRHDPTKTSGRKKNRASRAISEEDAASDDNDNDLLEFTTTGFAGKVRPPQNQAEVNGSIGGEKGRAEKKEETKEAAARRKEGQRISEEKERVKRAARRGIVFGFAAEHKQDEPDIEAQPNGENLTRRCEAIMNGKVVEPSFAKGDWGIRWRER